MIQRVCVLLLYMIFVFPHPAEAQLQRERADTGNNPLTLFKAQTNIGTSTVFSIDEGNLFTTIAHTFGLLNSGIEQFFGLDAGANTRLGLDYGINDRISIGIGRMTFNKVVDLKSRIHILKQTESGGVPLHLALKISAAVNTTPDAGLERSERLSYFTSIMAARKFGDLSLQVTPMLAHFNHTVQSDPNRLFAFGLLTGYDINQRFAISAEYLPVIGQRNAGTKDAGGISLNIDTGGHLFQIYVSTSQWHNEQFILANNRDSFWDGDIRFGFNIHRVFSLKN